MFKNKKVLFFFSLVLFAQFTTAVANADELPPLAVKGKALFVVCSACHATDTKPSIKIGPSLKGIVGRDAATLSTFRYSTALSEQTLTWDESNLDKWLQRPAEMVPGNIMSFAGLSNAEQREAIIAYLKTL